MGIRCSSRATASPVADICPFFFPFSPYRPYIHPLCPHTPLPTTATAFRPSPTPSALSFWGLCRYRTPCAVSTHIYTPPSFRPGLSISVTASLALFSHPLGIPGTQLPPSFRLTKRSRSTLRNSSERCSAQPCTSC